MPSNAKRVRVYSTFFIISLLSLGSSLYAQTAGGSRYALVVGNSDYAGLPSLKNPVNDASDMAAALGRMGFIVDLRLNADLGQMEDGAVILADRLSKDKHAMGIFFFAGHGIQSDGINYLIPSSAYIKAEAFLKTRALSSQTMLDLMQGAGNDLNLLFLDACRDNPYSWKRSGTRGLSVVGNQPPGSIVVYATGAGGTAADGEGRNGVFTAELLKNIETPGLDLDSILNRTAQGVLQVTSNRQNPSVYKQYFETAYLTAGDYVRPVNPVASAAPERSSSALRTDSGNLLLNVRWKLGLGGFVNATEQNFFGSFGLNIPLIPKVYSANTICYSRNRAEGGDTTESDLFFITTGAGIEFKLYSLAPFIEFGLGTGYGKKNYWFGSGRDRNHAWGSETGAIYYSGSIGFRVEVYKQINLGVSFSTGGSIEEKKKDYYGLGLLVQF